MNIPHFANIYRELVGNFYRQTSMLPQGFQTTAEVWLTNIEAVATQKVLLELFQVYVCLLTTFNANYYSIYRFLLAKGFSIIRKNSLVFNTKKVEKVWKGITRNINISLGNYIRGQLIVCLLVAIIFVGLLIIGMPYAVILGSLSVLQM
ncbi:AI-2E family transporter [Anaerobacillus sp. HL2]|nr:AI-2E family transporter [Anaerobacillus sp. HL2]